MLIQPRGWYRCAQTVHHLTAAFSPQDSGPFPSQARLQPHTPAPFPIPTTRSKSLAALRRRRRRKRWWCYSSAELRAVSVSSNSDAAGSLTLPFAVAVLPVSSTPTFDTSKQTPERCRHQPLNSGARILQTHSFQGFCAHHFLHFK